MKKVRRLETILLLFILLLMPVCSSLNGHSLHQSCSYNQLNHPGAVSFFESRDDKIPELLVFDVRGSIVSTHRYALNEQEMVALYTAMNSINNQSMVNQKKIELFSEILGDYDCFHLQSRLSNMVTPWTSIDAQHSVSFTNEVEGFLGVLTGSFKSDYEDNGFLCLGFPFPFLNAFPLFFTGFGKGDLYFSGILEDGSYGVSHLRFDEFVSLFSLFFFGTVVLFPLAYFGFQGFMFGISFMCMGSGR